MARYEDDDESFDYGSLPEIQQQEFLYELIGFKEQALDSDVREMFWDLMYNDNLTVGERQDVLQELSGYVYDEYGIEFQEVWDWDAFREWYD